MLAVVKHYIDTNSNISYDELDRVFPEAAHGRGCLIFSDINDIKHERRFFCRSEDIILLSDGTRIAVSNQWGIESIPNFIKYAQRLEYKIEEIS